jgi:hypothetical protein
MNDGEATNWKEYYLDTLEDPNTGMPNFPTLVTILADVRKAFQAANRVRDTVNRLETLCCDLPPIAGTTSRSWAVFHFYFILVSSNVSSLFHFLFHSSFHLLVYPFPSFIQRQLYLCIPCLLLSTLKPVSAIFITGQLVYKLL